jgi:hypothetical protein
VQAATQQLAQVQTALQVLQTALQVLQTAPQVLQTALQVLQTALQGIAPPTTHIRSLIQNQQRMTATPKGLLVQMLMLQVDLQALGLQQVVCLEWAAVQELSTRLQGQLVPGWGWVIR